MPVFGYKYSDIKKTQPNKKKLDIFVKTAIGLFLVVDVELIILNFQILDEIFKRFQKRV